MNIKNNKGYVAIDASISVLILLIIVPTIAGMIYNVNTTNNFIERKTEAVSMAVNAIEIVKGIGVTGEINEETITASLKDIYKLSDDNRFTKELINHDTTEFDDKITSIKGTITKNDNTYKIQIDIQDYANTSEAVNKNKESGTEFVEGVAKTVKVIVTFKAGKQERNIELNTVIS